MTPSPHLTAAQVAGWQSASLRGEEVLATSDHLRDCAACQARVRGERTPASVASEVVRRLHEDEEIFEHLTAEQLSRWVDGKPDGVEEELVRSHLELCESCRAEAEDLRRFARTLQAPLWAGSWGRIATAAALAALIAFAVWSRWHLEAPSPRAAPKPAATTAAQASPLPASGREPARAPLAVLRDGPLEIDGDGRVRGVEGRWKTLAEAAWKAPDLALPAAALAVARLPEQQRAEAATPPAVRLRHPVSRVVLEDRPELRWEGPGDATYRVEIYDDEFTRIAGGDAVREQSWRPGEALPRGQELTWKLTVVGSDGAQAVYPVPPAPPAVFRIASAATVRDVAAARATGSHLIAGLVLWRAGLVDDGAAELAALAQANPGSAAARRLAAASARRSRR